MAPIIGKPLTSIQKTGNIALADTMLPTVPIDKFTGMEMGGVGEEGEVAVVVVGVEDLEGVLAAAGEGVQGTIVATGTAGTEGPNKSFL
jgi:hypothetical protein